jgi:hypothetical protein
MNRDRVFMCVSDQAKDLLKKPEQVLAWSTSS